MPKRWRVATESRRPLVDSGGWQPRSKPARVSTRVPKTLDSVPGRPRQETERHRSRRMARLHRQHRNQANATAFDVRDLSCGQPPAGLRFRPRRIPRRARPAAQCRRTGPRPALRYLRRTSRQQRRGERHRYRWPKRKKAAQERDGCSPRLRTAYKNPRTAAALRAMPRHRPSTRTYPARPVGLSR